MKNLRFTWLILGVVFGGLSYHKLLQALPTASGCNSPHDCLITNNTHNNLTCDYTSSTCRHCPALGERCDVTKPSYIQCCPGYSCDHTGHCITR